jgi:hypothetical protein
MTVWIHFGCTPGNFETVSLKTIQEFSFHSLSEFEWFSLLFSSLSFFDVHVWMMFSGPTEVTVLPQIDYYHPSRQLVPISMATFNLSSSITIQDGTWITTIDLFNFSFFCLHQNTTSFLKLYFFHFIWQLSAHRRQSTHQIIIITITTIAQFLLISFTWLKNTEFSMSRLEWWTKTLQSVLLLIMCTLSVFPPFGVWGQSSIEFNCIL